MSNMDSTGDANDTEQIDFSAVEFERGLSLAKVLIEKGDLDNALKLLLGLEVRYVGAAAVFDLLGETLLARGNIKEGIRYKTLYGVLRGTFRIVTEEDGRDGIDYSGLRSPLYGESGGLGEPALDIDELIPVTPAMGHEFVRQGHYHQAVKVFDKLIARNPEDESLRQAKDEAAKKDSDQKLLGVFQRWLKNIEQMKSDESASS
jgi:tetratricopeptide (TPR) repeat protein